MTGQPAARARWFKGHTHCHSTESDGNLPPEAVARWYRDHGYSFLSITDHYILTDPAELDGIETESFILIPGTELAATPLGQQTHTCGLNISAQLDSRRGATPAETMQMMADDIREAGGIMQVNHPNWMWGLSVDDIRPVKGAALLEVYNMGSGCNNEGDPANGRPPVEAIWDDLLTGGKVIWGVCSDDAHRYTEGHPDGPGKGWIVVKADRLTREDVMNSIEKGDFYASTGVELSDVLSTQEGISLTISPDSRSGFVTRFIGSGGKVLSEVEGLQPAYRFTGEEGYVRARVQASDGSLALTQPVWVCGHRER